jgi:hypothetical protein
VLVESGAKKLIFSYIQKYCLVTAKSRHYCVSIEADPVGRF